MNALARMWAERQLTRLQAADLRRLAREVREGFDKIEPLRREAERRRRENMRQDGPNGFVMIHR